MRLIDSHAHLDFEDFHDDFDAVLSRARQAGVEKMINIGADMDRSRSSVMIAEIHPHIFATVGVHPDEADKVDLDTIHDELLELAKSSEKVVGIGECGLDYFGTQNTKHKTNKTTRENQRRLFEIHIDVARHLGLPLVIHIRNGEDDQAVRDAYEILAKHKTQNTKHKNLGVIHCFTLAPDWAKRFIDLGFSLGFTGIITYKNAEPIREAVLTTPMDKILIETDCPFLAPQLYRGQRNEPAYVVEVAKKVAEIKQISLDKAAEQTTMNVEKLFGI